MARASGGRFVGWLLRQPFHRIMAGVLSPAIFCDWLTSYLGALAFFSESAGNPIVWMLATMLSVTALTVNTLTSKIYAETRSHKNLLLALWGICILYDAYTTMVGLANLLAGGGFFTIATINIFKLTPQISEAGVLFMAFATIIFVGSPMFVYWLWHENEPATESST